jgi:hypothetical protein
MPYQQYASSFLKVSMYLRLPKPAQEICSTLRYRHLLNCQLIIAHMYSTFILFCTVHGMMVGDVPSHYKWGGVNALFLCPFPMPLLGTSSFRAWHDGWGCALSLKVGRDKCPFSVPLCWVVTITGLELVYNYAWSIQEYAGRKFCGRYKIILKCWPPN